MRLTEAPLDTWMASGRHDYIARRRPDGWFEFLRVDPEAAFKPVFSQGVVSWEDHDEWEVPQ